MAATTGALNVGEYLAHERRELVPRAEAQQFYRGSGDGCAKISTDSTPRASHGLRAARP